MHCSGQRSNRLSLRQRLALPPMRLNNQTLPIGFLFLKLPHAVRLVQVKYGEVIEISLKDKLMEVS